MGKNGEFLIGAAVAAHQVEGNNTNSDFWHMEQMQYSNFLEKSGDAVDHYHRFREDLERMREMGLNAYRFSVEWARIEPERGKFDEKEVAHYRQVLDSCQENGLEPIVTLHHFTSPKWLIENGGWESVETPELFAGYAEYMIKELGDRIRYVCTINEANMAKMMSMVKRSRRHGEKAGLQVGINLENQNGASFKTLQKAEYKALFGTEKPASFMEELSDASDEIIWKAHRLAREKIKAHRPEIKVGITLSVHDFEAVEGGVEAAVREWQMEFAQYLPMLREDDFIGVQNYTRQLVGRYGPIPPPKGALRTQVNYEYYPHSLGNVIRKIAKDTDLPIFVTENGVAVEEDNLRVEFIKAATRDVFDCVEEGIAVWGYLYWSLMDNFEWQKGFSQTFGLMAVDRETMERTPRESFRVLGGICRDYNGKKA